MPCFTKEIVLRILDIMTDIRLKPSVEGCSNETIMYQHLGCKPNLNVLLFVLSGCCFVTFYTRKAALDAQNMMHNIKTMPGVSRSLCSPSAPV